MLRPYMRLSLLSLCVFCYASCLPLPASATDLNALVRHNWIRVDTPHFSIITEQPEATARQVVNDLEALRYFKTEISGMKALPVSKPLPMLAIGSDDGFAQLGLSKTWAGVFHIGLDGYSALVNIAHYVGQDKTDNWARMILLHEYFHFLVRMTVETLAYPTWVDEGMADYWATFNIDGPSVRLGDRVTSAGREHGLRSRSGRVSIDTRKIFNTTKLPLGSEKEEDKEEVEKFYGSAYFAAHYFSSTPALRSSINRYINMINLGYRQDRAAALAFNKPYEALDKEIIEYATRRLAARVLTASGSGFNFPEVVPTITRLDTPAVYANLARILPSYHLPKKDIRELLLKNRELNPGDADAQILPLLHGLDTSAAALADLERRFPANAKLLTLRADMLRRQAEYMKDSGAGDWLSVARSARDRYRAAIGIDRDYAKAYDGLGLAYALLPDSEPQEEAVAGFDTASIYTRDPQTFKHLADVFIRMNKPLDALPALRAAVAFNRAPVEDTQALLLDNIALLANLDGGGKASDAGLEYAGGTLYAGAVANNKPEGMGKISMPNGSYYEGPFAQGVPHGQGKLSSDSGLVYEGEFQHGVARGQGIVHYPAGSASISYTGGVDYMKPSGQGELLSKAGRYVGGFKGGDMHGAGVFTPAKKQVPLSGKWLRGGMEWPAAGGIVFRGPVNENGQRHGKGVCSAENASEVPGACRFEDDKLVEARE